MLCKYNGHDLGSRASVGIWKMLYMALLPFNSLPMQEMLR